MICISNKFPGKAPATGEETTLEEEWLRWSPVLVKSLPVTLPCPPHHAHRSFNTVFNTFSFPTVFWKSSKNFTQPYDVF